MEHCATIIHTQMAEIPGGSIELRDDRTNRIWTVELEPYLLSKVPVTQAFYFDVMNERPGTFKGDRRPVESVTWKDAVIFCNTLPQLNGIEPCYSLTPGSEDIVFNREANGFRLPAEAEWQYACQAGTKKIRYGKLDEIAWFKDNSDHQTQEVGKKLPNEWGLYDMLGNVWEWCSDIYDESTYGSYRLFRGGGWCDEERSVMATTRRRSHPLNLK